MDYGLSQTGDVIDFSDKKIKTVNPFSFAGAAMGKVDVVDLSNNPGIDLGRGFLFQSVIHGCRISIFFVQDLILFTNII